MSRKSDFILNMQKKTSAYTSYSWLKEENCGINFNFLKKNASISQKGFNSGSIVDEC